MLPQYTERYLFELTAALAALDRRGILALAEALMQARREGRQVLLMGNGGSSALASHMANDLNKIVVPGQARWRALSLTDNVPLLTAWANDVAYDQVFAEQLRNLCRPGDLVIGVSCSGNSANVLEGLRAARELGARTAGLTGDEGGLLPGLVDLYIRAPASFIGQQEDIHLVLDHLLAGLLRGWVTEIARRTAQPPRALLLTGREGGRGDPLAMTRPGAVALLAGPPAPIGALAWLAQHGVREAAVQLDGCVELITDLSGNGHDGGAPVSYSPGNRLPGADGAARRLQGFLKDGPFVVVYGDMPADVDLTALLEFHHERAVIDPGTAATLALHRVAHAGAMGPVQMDGQGRITGFGENRRPGRAGKDLAAAGVLVAEPPVLDRIPDGEFSGFGADLLRTVSAAGALLYGWTIPGSRNGTNGRSAHGRVGAQAQHDPTGVAPRLREPRREAAGHCPR